MSRWGLDLRDRVGKPYGVFIKPHHGGVDVSSALLDRINERSGLFLAPVTMRPEWPLLFDAGADALYAFMAGMVRGMEWTHQGVRFVHTSADVVRMVHSRLFWTFGVPSRLSISPHEPETVTHKARRSSPESMVHAA